MEKKTPQEALLGISPNNNTVRIIDLAAYAFKHKENRESKFDKRSEVGVYLSLREGMFKIYSPSIQAATATKPDTFDEEKVPLVDSRTSNYVKVEEGTDNDETVPREISSHEEIDAQPVLGSNRNVSVHPTESDKVDSHTPSELSNASTNFQDNSDAVDASTNKQGAQEVYEPTGIHRYP